jgi:hypothetical protein
MIVPIFDRTRRFQERSEATESACSKIPSMRNKPLTDCGVGYRSFTEPYFHSCKIGRRPQSGKAAGPDKKDRGYLKNCPFALTGPLTARNHGGNWKPARELHSGPFLACSKTYDLSAPNPLSTSASLSEIYLTGDRFVGNALGAVSLQ